MNIVITGGAGFIGSHLARRLLKEGHQLTVVDNFSPQVHSKDDLGAGLHNEVRLIRGDVRDRDLMDSALKGQDVVVHLAAETGTGQSMYEIEKYVDVNIKGTSVLLDLLANGRHSVGKVVVASSRAIYGEGKYLCPADGVVYPAARTSADMDKGDFEPKCPCCGASLTVAATDEESKLHPASVYGITKQNQEQMVLTVCGTLGIPAVALRYQNVYGPGQSLSNPYTGILSIFSTRIKNGNDIDVFEDGKESRDFVYIDDVVDATVRGIGSASAGSAVFNVGSGVATDVLTVAQTLVRQYGAQTEIKVTGNYRLGDIRHNYADTGRIAEALGYRPQVSFSEGIEKFVAWVNRQEVEADRSAQSLEEMRRKGLFK